MGPKGKRKPVTQQIKQVNPLKEKAPKPKPYAQPGLVAMGGKTPLK